MADLASQAVNSDSILNSIKKMLGFEPDYTVFDQDITIHINTVFSVLYQIGASPPEGFYINTAEATWNDFIKDVMAAQMVKTYVYLKVRLLFDPPATSFALDSTSKQAAELEYRLHMMEIEFNPAAFVVEPVVALE